MSSIFSKKHCIQGNKKRNSINRCRTEISGQMPFFTKMVVSEIYINNLNKSLFLLNKIKLFIIFGRHLHPENL